MFNEAALCNARKVSSLTSLPIKQAGFMHFHDFWGLVKINQCSQRNLKINPITLLTLEVYISWYFVHYLPVSENLARIQPGTAFLDRATGTSLHDPACSCSSRSWAFASIGGSPLAQGQHGAALAA